MCAQDLGGWGGFQRMRFGGWGSLDFSVAVMVLHEDVTYPVPVQLGTGPSRPRQLHILSWEGCESAAARRCSGHQTHQTLAPVSRIVVEKCICTFLYQKRQYANHSVKKMTYEHFSHAVTDLELIYLQKNYEYKSKETLQLCKLINALEQLYIGNQRVTDG